MRTVLTAIAFLVLAPALAFAGEDHEPIGDAINNVPLFDAHVHYKRPAWDVYSVENVIELMDKSGVAMALVSSTPDEGTIRLWQYAPNRIVPELRPYHGRYGSSNWTSFDGMADYLKQRLDAYPHEGIGEFHIHRLETSDRPLFEQVMKMAQQRNIIVHVHSGPEAVRWLHDINPNPTLVWAHAGLGESTDTIHQLMSEIPGLYADTSLREGSMVRDGELDPGWKTILVDFQDRLMIGSDTWVNTQWSRYEEIIKANRRFLALLPRSVAEKLAYKNAEKLFGRKVSMDQIGTR